MASLVTKCRICGTETRLYGDNVYSIEQLQEFVPLCSDECLEVWNEQQAEPEPEPEEQPKSRK